MRQGWGHRVDRGGYMRERMGEKRSLSLFVGGFMGVAPPSRGGRALSFSI